MGGLSEPEDKCYENNDDALLFLGAELAESLVGVLNELNVCCLLSIGGLAENEAEHINEISKLHRQIGSTTIYVTHDQVEAMTMADRIVIMKDGFVQQVGKPMELYDHPVNKFVAGFIGSPQMNFFDVTIDDNTVVFADGNRIELPENIIEKLGGKKDGLILGIRGEDIKLDAQNLDVFGSSKQSAVVENTEIMGTENNLYFTFGGAQTIARVSKYEISGIGDKIEFVFMPSKIHFFDKESEICLV